MTVIKQPTINPTRKLSAAVIVTAAMELARYLVQHFAPQYYDPGLWSAMAPVIVFVAGYFVKDEDNSPS